MGQLNGIWNVLRNWIFWGNRQRRGVHVRTLEKGSRGAVFCFGGIWEFHAELRRECDWGNLDLVFFGVLVGVPREAIEEGGHYCVLWCVWGNFKLGYSPECEWDDL
jgi:hypothetical protein